MKGSFPTVNAEGLAKAISAEILVDASVGAVQIELPYRINEEVIKFLLPEG